MSAPDDRPDQIEGISTDTSSTPGDPTLRTANAAPDLSDDPDDTAGRPAGDVRETPGDETPGTKLDPA
jgi:hypothetical protein